MKLRSYLLVFIVVGVNTSRVKCLENEEGTVVRGGSGEFVKDSNVSAIANGERSGRYGFNPPQIPIDGFFAPFGGLDGNGTNPIFGNPVGASLAIAKGGLLAILSVFKAVLPQALLIGLVLALLIAGVALFVCTLTDCGPSIFSVRGNHPFEPEFYNNRNSFEHDYDKIRHIYQGIDEHKNKYNQIHHEKEHS